MLDTLIGFASRYINLILLSSIVSTGALLGLRFIDRRAYRVRTRTLLLPLLGAFLFTLWVSPSCFIHWLSIGDVNPAHIVCNDHSFAQVRSICTGWVVLTGTSFTLATIQGIASYFFGDLIVRRIYRIKPLEASTAGDLYGVVRGLSEKAGISTPKIGLIETSSPQIFSVGRGSNSNIYVSVGLLETLTEEEIEGSLAHEIAHISNDDSFLKTFASSLRLATIFNLLGFLIEPAISRDREFLADEEGAWLTGKPGALASALLKLSETTGNGRLGGPSLGLITPQRRLLKVFSKHPPLEERLRRLLELGNNDLVV